MPIAAGERYHYDGWHLSFVYIKTLFILGYNRSTIPLSLIPESGGNEVIQQTIRIEILHRGITP